MTPAADSAEVTDVANDLAALPAADVLVTVGDTSNLFEPVVAATYGAPIVALSPAALDALEALSAFGALDEEDGVHSLLACWARRATLTDADTVAVVALAVTATPPATYAPPVEAYAIATATPAPAYATPAMAYATMTAPPQVTAVTVPPGRTPAQAG
ncbi:hypothetical protein [Dactylosporangium sp. NPDC051484]|uniref:hypothetical protein n=1 Tax=Dactylosporangium sp. NPDC051484 TaxID=3154942 RepID=UPI00344F1358